MGVKNVSTYLLGDLMGLWDFYRENYSNAAAQWAQNVFMCLVAKGTLLLFHQAEGIWQKIWAGCAPHLEHNSIWDLANSKDSL